MTLQEPEEINDETEPEVEETGETGQLKQAQAEEAAKAENYLANWQRVQADFENYKRRAVQDKEELRKFANSVIILNFLSVVDDLERAFDSVPSEIADVGWVEGIKLIERKLVANMEAHGLVPIKALGETFDPGLHEAVRQDNGKEGIIIEEVQKGYTLHDRVLRPSQVIVGNGETDKG
ncbi:MAG: nucleotide exchange factor GrpE [Dehalococcoidales bacterium]